MLGPLIAALIIVPLLEIYVIVQVGHAIGLWWTVFALIAETVVGGWLVRREGRKAWRNLVAQLAEGRTPTRTAVDGAVILVGGLLLVTPGFVTDFFGFLCVIPFTRPLIRRALVGFVNRRSGGLLTAGAPFDAAQQTRPHQQGSYRSDVIEGHDVIEGTWSRSTSTRRVRRS